MGRESPGANSPDTMRAPMMRVTCALIVLIAESAQTSNPGASLLDYLETVAITGRLAFFSRQLGIDDRATPTRNQWELEDMICGSSN